MSSASNVTSPIYPVLERAAIAAWSGGLPFAQSALAKAIAPEIGESAEQIGQALPTFLGVLARQGVYTAQRARYGAKTQGDGQLTSPQCFNWSTISPEVATLRQAVEPYLADDAIVPARKHAVRSAVRFALELPTKCDDVVLLSACARVSAEELYTLPGRAYDAALAPPNALSKQTAANHRASIRAVMRYAAERRLIPIVFPRIWNDDAWERDKDRFFPLCAEGPTPHQIMAWRWAWTVLASTFATLEPDLPNDLSSLTREIAEKVIEHIQGVEGRYSLGYNARGALRYLAKHFGVGPFVEPAPADAFRVQTAMGFRPAVYLRGPNGEGGDGDWGAFFGILAHHGLPAEMTEFLEWYRVYITATALESISSKNKFPPRRERLRLDENTLMERMTALRAFLGVAVYELKPSPEAASLGLSIEPSLLTPELAFGFRFQEILGALVEWWHARADALPDGKAGKSSSGALRQMTIGLGMVALALYERLRHQRRLRVSTDRTSGGNERIDWRAEEELEKSPAEAAAWDAYRDASRMSDALAGVGKARNGSKRAQRTNDFRDIRMIVQNTPPKFWIDLLRGLLAEMRKSKAAGEDHGYAYHNTVANAFLLGLLISTGCRIEELCHLRLDVQAVALRSERIVRLRAIDRKNSKAQDVLVQREFVPDDLMDEYLERTRPWFMAGCPGVARGGLRGSSTPKKRPLVTPHTWLLVSTSGRSFGCEGERVDGSNRNKRAFKRRCAQCGLRFKAQLSRAARKLKMKLPGRQYEFGPHTVRAACGYGVFLIHGIQKAAHYLGDEEETVRDAYSSINGVHVDSTCLTGLDVGPQFGTAARSASVSASPRAAELQRLLNALNTNVLDEERFLREVSAVVRGPAVELLAAY